MTYLKSALFAVGLAMSTLASAAAPVVTPPQTPSPVSAPEQTLATPEGVRADTGTIPQAPPPTTIGTSAPNPEVGQPIVGKIGLQPQVTKLGVQAAWIHDWILMPMMVGISLFVLGLMLYVMARYRRKANPVASKTSHNTTIEVIWTLVPVLILVAIAVPSISLLAAQFKPAPKNAVTLKAIGNQWFWSYEYPDHGISEFTSNMLTDAEAKARGEPRTLAVDNRVVLPVNTPIRLITTANDVIHSWAMPAFWIKMDSVPGRLNETSFTVEKTGVYYGQCSELCGIKHAYMPIAVEVVSQADFAAWVAAKGGTMPGAAAAPAPVVTPGGPGSSAVPVATGTDNAAAPAANAAAPAAAMK